MQENITGVVKAWLEQNQNDVFSSINDVQSLIKERVSFFQNVDENHQTMIEIFCSKSPCQIEDFPPKDIDSFLSFLCLVENSIYRKFAIIYFLIDEFSLTQGRSIEDVHDFANLILVSQEQVQFVIGCINLDSSISTPQLVKQLSFPGLPHFFEFPIISSLLERAIYQDAFIFYLCKKPIPLDAAQNEIVVKVFSYSDRLYEGLKHIRSLKNEQEKSELLKLMFEISYDRNNSTAFTNLILTSAEEDQILGYDFPNDSEYKKFCVKRRRFDKIEEGCYFEHENFYA